MNIKDAQTRARVRQSHTRKPSHHNTQAAQTERDDLSLSLWIAAVTGAIGAPTMMNHDANALTLTLISNCARVCYVWCGAIANILCCCARLMIADRVGVKIGVFVRVCVCAARRCW